MEQDGNLTEQAKTQTVQLNEGTRKSPKAQKVEDRQFQMKQVIIGALLI